MKTKNKKILFMSLKASPFEVMLTREKTIEYRTPGKWINSRLFNKDGSRKEYDLIKFVNGYGNHRPSFTCEYRGFFIQKFAAELNYSNGLRLFVSAGTIAIMCGKIIKAPQQSTAEKKYKQTPPKPQRQIPLRFPSTS